MDRQSAPPPPPPLPPSPPPPEEEEMNHVTSAGLTEEPLMVKSEASTPGEFLQSELVSFELNQHQLVPLNILPPQS